MDMEQTHRNLSRRGYGEIEDALEPLRDEDLIRLLDSSSVKIGDTAAEVLSSRGGLDAIVDAILGKSIRTSIGKVRATWVLLRVGRKFLRAEAAYLALLGDRSSRVVDNALFGLVFLQDKKNAPAMEEARRKAPVGSKVHRYLTEALEALEKQNPFIFSPHFVDAEDVWGLDKKRFGKRIGL